MPIHAARRPRTRRSAALAALVLLVSCTGDDDTSTAETGPSEHAAPAGASGTVGTPPALAIELTMTTPSTASVPIGEPVEVTLELDNPGTKSVSTTIELTLATPDGQLIPFHRTTLFVPFGDSASETVSLTTARWVPDLGRFEVRAGSTDASVAAGGAAVAFDVAPTDRVVPIFEDVTEQAGLVTHVPEPACGQFANGAAWGDVDGDGWPDLLVTRLDEPTQLFLNAGDGTFREESSPRGAAIAGANGAAFADYDGDGDDDLVLVGDGPDVLLRNDGTGHFDDVSTRAGIAGAAEARGMSAAWGDFDGDGLLDLYVTNYMQCTGPWTTEEEIIANVEYDADVLYRNTGDGTFTDATDLLPEADDFGAGFTAAWLDADDDGLLDLYVGNDFVGISPDHNRLWRNTSSAGAPAFTDVSLESGAGLYMNTMGVGIGDVDRDGEFDLALSNIGGNKLLRSNGDATYTEDLDSGIERPMQGIDHTTITWGTVIADFDLDGWDDVLMAAGNLPQAPEVVIGEQPNMLFLNDGTGEHLLDVSSLTGIDAIGDSKGIAAADYDRDGALDVFVVDQGGIAHLYRNVTPRADRHWIELDLAGDACGARVTIAAGGATIGRLVTCGSGGTGSGHHTRVHAGVGTATTIDEITATWPSGERRTLTAVPVDQVVTVPGSVGSAG
jgi:hypothetical protein